MMYPPLHVPSVTTVLSHGTPFRLRSVFTASTGAVGAAAHPMATTIEAKAASCTMRREGPSTGRSCKERRYYCPNAAEPPPLHGALLTPRGAGGLRCS